MNLKVLIILFLAISSAGCLPTHNIKKDYNFSSNNNSGLAVFTVTHDKVEAFGGVQAAYVLYSPNETEENDYGITTGKSRNLYSDPQKAILWGKKESLGIDGQEGFLHVVELEEGEHQLKRWFLKSGSKHFHVRPEFRPDPIRFYIKRGEVRYLGNLHTSVQPGKNVFGIRMVFNGVPVISDHFERDIKIIEEKYPQLADRVVSTPLESGLWVKKGYLP